MPHTYAFLWVLLLLRGNDIRFYRGKIHIFFENKNNMHGKIYQRARFRNCWDIFLVSISHICKSPANACPLGLTPPPASSFGKRNLIMIYPISFCKIKRCLGIKLTMFAYESIKMNMGNSCSAIIHIFINNNF